VIIWIHRFLPLLSSHIVPRTKIEDERDLKSGPGLLVYLHFLNVLFGGWGVAQVVECLPSECNTLSSNSNTTTTKKKVLNALNLPNTGCLLKLNLAVPAFSWGG
jgi:hypothetical protein